MPAQQFVDILFGPYEPDWGGMPRPDVPGYLVDALGVRLTPNGYTGMPVFADVASATAIGSSLSSARAACYFTTSTINFFVVNDSGEVYESRAEGTDTWENVSPATGSPDVFGDFVRFGNDAIYVSASRAPISKTLTASHATDFASLAGSPPTGSCAARVRSHVVIGKLSTDPYAVRTSALGAHTDWPTPGTADARSKQAITESLNPEFGFVERVLGGEKFGVVVQTTALTRMTYVGGSNVYEFDPYHRTSGGGYSGYFGRPVTDGVLWYLFNESGIYATDGYSVRNISEGKLDAALFLNQLSHANGTSLSAAFTAVYDDRRRMVLWSNNAYSAGTYYQLAYSIDTQSFSLMNENFRTAFFDGIRSSGTTNLNGRNVYNINGSNRKLQRLGTIGTPTIAMQTGYIELEPGYRCQIQGAHLIGANLPTTLTLSYKAAQTLDDIDVLQSGFTSFTAANRGLKYTGRADAPFFSFRVTGSGAEAHLYRGIRVYYERTAPN